MDARLTKVLKKNALAEEYAYLIFCEKGLIAFNGSTGVCRAPKFVGEKLMSIVDEIGPYAIVDGPRFLQILSSLEDTRKVSVDKDNSCLKIHFQKGQGVVNQPILMDLDDTLQHMHLPFVEWGIKPENSIPITSIWTEVANLVTSDGAALFADALGLYGDEKKLVSFDAGLFLEKPLEDGEVGKQFFCPAALLDLKVADMECAILVDDSIVLVGEKAQYCSMLQPEENYIEDLESLKEKCLEGKSFEVELNITKTLWKRVRLFSPLTLEMRIKGGNIIIGQDQWKEKIGQTTAPDHSFIANISLIKRWADNCSDQKIIKVGDDDWYLSAITRGGMNFYAVLTDQLFAQFEDTDDEQTSNVMVIDEASEETPKEVLTDAPNLDDSKEVIAEEARIADVEEEESLFNM